MHCVAGMIKISSHADYISLQASPLAIWIYSGHIINNIQDAESLPAESLPTRWLLSLKKQELSHAHLHDVISMSVSVHTQLVESSSHVVHGFLAHSSELNISVKKARCL